MKTRTFTFPAAETLLGLLLVSYTFAWAAPASATLTSNSQSKSQMPDEVEQTVSIQTATAIASVAELVKDIEEADSLDVGFESLDIALATLDELIRTLEDNLQSASESTILLGDIILPDEAMEDPDDARRSEQALRAAVTFVTANIGGSVSDRALAEFLLREARQAQRALDLARLAAENQNPDLMRLAILQFNKFTYAAVSYSIVWSLVPVS